MDASGLVGPPKPSAPTRTLELIGESGSEIATAGWLPGTSAPSRSAGVLRWPRAIILAPDRDRAQEARTTQLKYRLAIVGLIVAVACGAIAWLGGDARLGFVGLTVGYVLSPLLATGSILLLHRVGLIDDEAAGRLGCIHGLGLLMLPVLVLLVIVPGSTGVFMIPVAILSLFGFDVLTAIAFRLGWTKRRSITDRAPGRRETARTSFLKDPARSAAERVIGRAVDLHMRALRETERPRYGAGQAVARLLLVVTLPFLLLAAAGALISISGYDGAPLLIVGLLGTTIGIAAGLLLGSSRDDR